MDFSLSAELQELQSRTRAFIRDKIIPLEGDERQTHHGPTEEFRRELVALAAAEGLVAPHVGVEYGGLGLSHVGKAVVFEEAGYSLLGPVAMHIFAPDEGNMHLLEAVASTEQKERWLRPLARGDIRSCFCMTEPAPGAGSVMQKQDRVVPAASGRRKRSFCSLEATASSRCMLPSSGAKMCIATGPSRE